MTYPVDSAINLFNLTGAITAKPQYIIIHIIRCTKLFNLCFPKYFTVLDNQIALSLQKIFCVKMKFILELLESRKSNKGCNLEMRDNYPCPFRPVTAEFRKTYVSDEFHCSSSQISANGFLVPRDVPNPMRLQGKQLTRS